MSSAIVLNYLVCIDRFSSLLAFPVKRRCSDFAHASPCWAWKSQLENYTLFHEGRTKETKERFGDLPGHDHSLYWPNNETADTQSLQKQNWTAAYAGKPLPAWAQELVDMVIIAHHIQRARNSALSLIHLCWHRGLLKDTVKSGHNAQWRSSARYRNTWWLLPTMSVPYPSITPPCSSAIAALLSRNCFSAPPTHKDSTNKMTQLEPLESKYRNTVSHFQWKTTKN